VILSQEIQLVEILVIFSAISSAIASPMQVWLHMPFLPHAGDTTILKKSRHHRKLKITHVATALLLTIS